MNSFNLLIAQILDIYMIIIVIRALLSWFAIQSDSPLFSIYVFLVRITEPVLGWFRAQMRKIAPNMMFDISPVIVIVLLNIIKNLLLRA